MNQSKPESTNQLSDCAHDHIKKVQALSTIELEKEYDLPCGCASVSTEGSSWRLCLRTL